MKQLKVIVEKHPDGYVAYPLGLKGVVVGQGDSYEDALSDVKLQSVFTSKALEKRCLTSIPQYLRHLLLKR